MSVAVVTAVARLYALLVLGWGLRRTGRVGPEVADGLTVAVTDVTMPALIVSTFVSRPLEWSSFGAVAVAYAALGVSFGLAWVLGRRLPAPTKATFLLGATFCNTGFLGIPLAEALWGHGSAGLATAVLVDSVTTTVLLNTVGVLVAMRGGGGQGRLDGAALGRLVRAPMFLAVPVGLVAARVGLPDAVSGVLAEVGATTATLVFLATGMRLRFAGALRNARLLATTTAIRFIASPLVAWGVAVALGLTGEVRTESVLEVAMPTALMVPVVASRYGADPDLGPVLVAVTTALAPLSLVAWYLLVHR